MPTNPNNDDAAVSEGANGRGDGETPDPFEHVVATEHVDTDRWRLLQQTHYDREGSTELATVLALAISEATGVDPVDAVEMPPLYESIDAEAVEETFFGPSGAGTRRDEEGVLTFLYNDLKVALRSDGWIFVYEPR